MPPLIATLRCTRGLRPAASTLRRVRFTPSHSVHLLVGCYTNDHEPLAYYTNTATDKGAYVVNLDPADGRLSVLDVRRTHFAPRCCLLSRLPSFLTPVP